MKPREWDMKRALQGTLLLTLATFIVKVLSVAYRIPYQNIVGDEGFYVYQQVYPIIGIFMTWTAYGFSVALSKWLVESETEEVKAARFRIGFLYALTLLALLALYLAMKAPSIAKWMGDDALTPLIRTTAWVALLVPFVASMKGYLQANGQFRTIAYSNVAEQFVRVGLILFGASTVLLSNASIYTAGQWAVWGSVVGSVVAILLLYRPFFREKGSVRRVREPFGKSVIHLTLYSLSFSMSALILLLFQLVDSFTLVNGLIDSGHSFHEAITMKGQFDRGQPFVQVGILVATTFSLLFVPLIARTPHTAYEKRQVDRLIRKTFHFAFAFGAVATLGLILVLSDLNIFFFKENVQYAALALFLCQIVALSFILPMTAILQGKGKLLVPFLLYVASFIIKWSTASFFATQYGTFGASIGSNLSFFLLAVSLYVYFRKQYALSLQLKTFTKRLLLALFVMMCTVILTQHILFDPITRFHAGARLVVAAAVGAITFSWMIVRLSLFDVKDWALLPKGRLMMKWQLNSNRRRNKK